MNLLDKISNRSQLILIALVVFSVFVGLGCISASDLDSGNSQIAVDGLDNPIPDEIFDGDFLTMSERYNTGTGYQWVISPKSYGIRSMNKTCVIDHPNMPGSSATVCFAFMVDKDYYVQLDYISPTGEIVKSSFNSSSVN